MQIFLIPFWWWKCNLAPSNVIWWQIFFTDVIL
jgi:hypothetical protein